jgi:hypothetical protein
MGFLSLTVKKFTIWDLRLMILIRAGTGLKIVNRKSSIENENGCQGWTRTNTERLNKPPCYFHTTWQWLAEPKLGEGWRSRKDGLPKPCYMDALNKPVRYRELQSHLHLRC